MGEYIIKYGKESYSFYGSILELEDNLYIWWELQFDLPGNWFIECAQWNKAYPLRYGSEHNVATIRYDWNGKCFVIEDT